MSQLLSVLWPVFALILAGAVMQRFGFPGAGFWPGAERLNYYVLFPALLVRSLTAAPLDNPALARLAGTALAALGIASCVLLLARWLTHWPARRFGVWMQGSLRFNTYLGLALVGSLYGPPGLTLAAVLLAAMVPVVNVLSVLALTAGRQRGWREWLLPVLRNPLIVACAAGVALHFAGVHWDAGSDRLLQTLGSTSLPLGLLCVGAALRIEDARSDAWPLAALTGVRLLAMPALAWALSRLAGLPPLESAVLLLFFALPGAPTSYVLTRQLGGDSAFMAATITLQTLASSVTLGWLLHWLSR